MNRAPYIVLLLFLGILLSGTVELLRAHGYVFGKSNEEMRDNIRITLGPKRMLIEYQAIYQGQIAPHVRNMIDTNGDYLLNQEEVKRFLSLFKKTFQEAYPRAYILINGKYYRARIDSLDLPRILQDSLLAPLKVWVRFWVEDFSLLSRVNNLEFDPRFFFLIGDHFIQLAKRYVAFTDEQEAQIGRYLQIELYGSRSIRFTRTFPGRIRKDKKSVYIYGVFYDQNIKKLHHNQIPRFRVELVRE